MTSSETTTNPRLEACHEVDEEWMADRVGRLKHASFRHQTLHFVPCNYVTLLQRLYCKILTRHLVLSQQHLHASEMIPLSEQHSDLTHAHTHMHTHIQFLFNWPTNVELILFRPGSQSRSSWHCCCSRFSQAGRPTNSVQPLKDNEDIHHNTSTRYTITTAQCCKNGMFTEVIEGRLLGKSGSREWTKWHGKKWGCGKYRSGHIGMMWQGWTMQEWTNQHDVARVDIA